MSGLNKILIFLLLASLGFNVFFIYGYLSSRSTLEKLGTPEGRIQLFARKFNLSKEQEEQIIALNTELRGKMDSYDKENKAELDEFWGEMIKDKPDSDRIDVLLETTSTKRKQLRRDMVRFFQKVFALLTPEQRRQVAQMIRERSFLKQIQ